WRFKESGALPVAGTTPRAVAVGSFGSGPKGVAVANYDSNNVSILLGNGDGTLKAATNYAVGAKPVALATGRFNNDAYTDIAVANSGSNTVTILLASGNGNGTFQRSADINVGRNPSAIVASDFNGDGKLDLA